MKKAESQNKLVLILLYFLLFSVFSTVSCDKRKNEVPADFSSVEGLPVSVEYLVISEPYAAYREKPSKSALVANNGRLADVVEVKGKKYVKNGNVTQLWYECPQGWLCETDVQLYKNLLQAQEASREFSR
ncbi:MAG: hypothetical protein MJ183_00230 [Treponemataceae bacterium]|nr:hypothetical protein [Treponemataceae bacterium]